MRYNKLQQFLLTEENVDYDQIEFFFNLVVEECARIAEEQARIYTGEHREGDGCSAAAQAIRLFGTQTRLR